MRREVDTGYSYYSVSSGYNVCPSRPTTYAIHQNTRFKNPPYDSGRPHPKFGAKPFENSKKRVFKGNDALFSMVLLIIKQQGLHSY